MVKAVRAFAFACGDDVTELLQMQGISFRGPFRTPGGRDLYLLDNHFVLESELIDLFQQNKLNQEGLRELFTNIEASGRGAPR